MIQSQEMLTLDHVSKSYGDRRVLDDFNLSIRPGEIYGLLGPNGAGKTTLINIICDLLKPDQGTVTLQGEKIGEKTKKWLGVAPQENIFYRSLTCWENLEFFAKIYGLNAAQRPLAIESCLQSVNLLDRAHTPVENLSGGMQRRLNLAIALVHHPKLLILDEPTTGLDIEARHDLWQLIHRLKNDGMTLLLTTHLLEEAQELCDRLGILKNGKILKQGSLNELRQLISAVEILTIQSPDKDQLLARGQQLGYVARQYGGNLTFWLPESLELQEILTRFDGISIEAIARSPVQLEHIYLEVTQNPQTL